MKSKLLIVLILIGVIACNSTKEEEQNMRNITFSETKSCLTGIVN